MFNPFRALPRPVSNFLYKRVPSSAVLDMWFEERHPLKDLIQLWRDSEASEEKDFLGYPISKATDFYTKCAERQYDECVSYVCAYGCCTVWWHPRQGNIGGMGPAGCPCDNLKDPRGEKVEDE